MVDVQRIDIYGVLSRNVVHLYHTLSHKAWGMSQEKEQIVRARNWRGLDRRGVSWASKGH